MGRFLAAQGKAHFPHMERSKHETHQQQACSHLSKVQQLAGGPIGEFTHF